MKVALLLSGGVDSSVALRLLCREGHDVSAFYLKIWLEEDASSLGSCPWQEDLDYAGAVCSSLSVPLTIVPLQREYHEKVVAYTIAAIKAGATPNPDIFCNARIKFDAFLEHIDRSFDKIASGHYARIERSEHNSGVPHLLCSPDPIKDQTYFLSYLKSEQLERLLLPIGTFTKKQVRELAHRYDLPTKNRKDSQGICFLGKLKFNDFIRHYCGNQTGELVEYETGTVIGSHEGFWYHTIGQRKGSRLAGGPWYVVAKDPTTNRIFLSRTYNDGTKRRDCCDVGSCNWIDYEPRKTILNVKLRHGPHRHTCCVEPIDDDGSLHVTLATNDQGIARGQFAVFYDGQRCLGAGIIR